jgi:hypothetical protein
MRSNINKQLDAVRAAWKEYDTTVLNKPKEAKSKYEQYEKALQQLEASFNHYQNEAPKILQQGAESAQNKAAAEHADFVTKTAASIIYNSPEKKRGILQDYINTEAGLIERALKAPQITKQDEGAISGARTIILKNKSKLDTLVELSANNHPISEAEAAKISAVNNRAEEVNTKAAKVMQGIPPPTSQP